MLQQNLLLLFYGDMAMKGKIQVFIYFSKVF